MYPYTTIDPQAFANEQAMILDTDFRDERQAIMQQIRKLADS